jgi:EAL domain-containing protein (putative c-di-GMP-specific phosphodiesterase class I)
MRSGSVDVLMERDEALAHLRHIQRLKQRTVAVLVRLGGLIDSSRSAALLHFLRNGLTELAERSRGRLFRLGRRFWMLLLEAPRATVERQLAVLFDIERTPGSDADRWRRYCELFELPADYAALRARMEQAEETAELAREQAMATAPPPSDASSMARNASASEETSAGPVLSGRLDARRLAALLHRLDGIDLAPFIRRQAVWRIGVRPEPIYVELYTSLADIARVHFPETVIDDRSPLADELRRHVDALLLAQLLLDRPFEQTAVGLNLTRAAIASPEFSWLVERTRAEQRARVILELPWQELLADLAAGGRLCRELQAAGFPIAADGLEPMVFDYIRPEAFDVPIVKLVFGEASAARFAEPALSERLAQLPAQTVVLARCDQRSALIAARQLGIRHLQGWLVDRLVREPPPAVCEPPPMGEPDLTKRWPRLAGVG